VKDEVQLLSTEFAGIHTTTHERNTNAARLGDAELQRKGGCSQRSKAITNNYAACIGTRAAASGSWPLRSSGVMLCDAGEANKPTRQSNDALQYACDQVKIGHTRVAQVLDGTKQLLNNAVSTLGRWGGVGVCEREGAD
jgi:hypothetical protein